MLPLSDPWYEPGPDLSRALRREALAEIGNDHQLAGRDITPMAKCDGCDRAIFKIDDGTFAIIHLTWVGHQDRAPWPTTRIFRSADDMLKAARKHQH